MPTTAILDVRLETGLIGFALLASFIITTLYAIRRVAGRDPVRAWMVLSLALFVILDNFLETVWMRGFSVLWSRNWSILAPFAADKGGVWIED